MPPVKRSEPSDAALGSIDPGPAADAQDAHPPVRILPQALRGIAAQVGGRLAALQQKRLVPEMPWPRALRA